MNIIESYSTPVFREHGLSQKDIFTKEEFDVLLPKLELKQVILKKEERKQQLQMILNQANAPKAVDTYREQLEQELIDIGELPEEAPASLYERFGWVELKKRKAQIIKELNTATPEVADPVDYDALETELAALIDELEELYKGGNQ